VDAMLTNGESPMPVIEAEKVKTKKTYTNSGHVIASLAHIEHRPTFTDVRMSFLLTRCVLYSKGSFYSASTISCCFCLDILLIHIFKVMSFPPIFQFITGGCEISLIAAIDYTGSNGDPDMPSSLHYISPTGILALCGLLFICLYLYFWYPLCGV